MSFQHVQLHNHSSKSPLDGVSTIADLCKSAADCGAKGIALTDHGNIMAEYELYAAAKEYGIKPILGIETYVLNAPVYIDVAKKANLDKDQLKNDPLADVFTYIYGGGAGYKKLHHHLLLLALNDTGAKNLRLITSFSHQRGYYYKPSVTHAIIQQYSDGILATSGCLGAEVTALLSKGFDKEAEQVLQWYSEVFKGRYYIELQRHDIPELEFANKKLIKLAEQFNLPVILTNDIHYATPDQKKVQELLIQLSTNVGKSSGKSDKEGGEQVFEIHGSGYHYRTPQEMYETFSDLPKVSEYLDNTVAIAEQVNYSRTIPKDFELPAIYPEKTVDQKAVLLRDLVIEGGKVLYGDPLPQNVIERIDFELNVIGSMGFNDYFLILYDLVEFFRSKNKIWNIRGSGGGSIVLYCLRISSTDPIAHNLLFERFLNPERVTLPDVDVDVPDTFRAEISNYFRDKYGHDNVARILTFGTLKLKAAIRDVARLHGVQPTNINQLSKAIPDEFNTVEELEGNATFMQFIQKYVDYQKILDTTRQLVGRIRNVGTHPAGILVTPQSITNYTAFHRPTDVSGENMDVTAIQPVHLDMGNAEVAHLVKFDLLGVRTLTIIDEALNIIAERTGKKVAFDDIPIQFNESYKVYGHGDTTGIFQVSSDQMTDILTRLQPKSLAQIVAIISLYRPGPLQFIDEYIRKARGEEEVKYLIPELEPILSETYGIIIYQEQVIQILKLSGFSGGEADMVRRAISKKKLKDMAKYKPKFVEGMKSHFNVSEADSDKVWADIEKFAGYGFNKSHSASYAQISAKTAWLKYNHRIEFLTACMRCEFEHLDKLMTYIGDARKAGIRLLPADVNHSDENFKIEGTNIRYGLIAIKHVQGEAIRELVKERVANGPFKNVEDLIARVKMDTSTFSALLLAGALDGFVKPVPHSHNIFALSTSQRYLMAMHVPPKYRKSISKMAGFEDTDLPKSPIPWLKAEYEILGETYLTNHPLKLLIDVNSRFRSGMVYPDFLTKKVEVNEKVTTIGLVTEVYKQVEKSYIFVQILGFNQPSVRMAVFPSKNFKKIDNLLQNGEGYLFVIDAVRKSGGFIINDLKKIGYVYDPNTYLPG